MKAMEIFIVHKCLFPSAGGCWPGAQSNPLYNRCISSAAPSGAGRRGEESTYYLHAGDIYIMVFYPTIGSTYFVKTQTYVALFGPHQLSIIFSGVMYLELSAL